MFSLSPLLLWTLVIIILGYILFYGGRTLIIVYYVNKIPGPPYKHFFVGNFEDLSCHPENCMRIIDKLGKEYYPIFKIILGISGNVLILNPDDFEIILSNVIHIEKGTSYKTLRYWLKTGLLTSTDAKWQLRRKMLTPTFHFNILQHFLIILNQHSRQLVETLKDECTKTATNVHPIISKSTLDVIGETAMGFEFDPNSTPDVEYKKAIRTIGEICYYKFMKPHYYINRFCDLIYHFTPCFWRERRILKNLHSFTRNVIKERMKSFKGIEQEENNTENVYFTKKRLAMMDLLLSLKDQGLIDDDGISEEVDTFMSAGHDTVSMTLSFTMMLLACHRNYQDQIVQEMEEVLGDINKQPTFSDLKDLKLMERVIKESLRLYPSVYYISRILGEDIVTNDGYFLKKGTEVHLLIWLMHRHPQVFPDPEKFDPDRFLPENTQNRHPFAYVPFSAGPRNCIGQRFALMEMKSMLCGILSNFILEPIDTPETVHLIPNIVLRTKDEIKVKFTHRFMK